MTPPRAHQDAVLELEADHAPDAELTATVHLPPGTRLDAIPVTIAVDGTPIDGWTGWFMPAVNQHTGELLAAAVGARAPNGAHFLLGQLNQPQDGDQVHGPVHQLLEQIAPMRNHG